MAPGVQRLLALLCVAVVPSSAAAAPVVPERAPAASSRTFVLLPDLSESGFDPGPYLAAVGDHSVGVGLAATVATPSPTPPLARALAITGQTQVLGVFWLDRTGPALTVYLYEPRGQGVYIRRLARGEGESESALVEAVGLIVVSTAVALREGRELGMRPADAAEVAQLQPEPDPPLDPEPALEEPVVSDPEPKDPEPKDPEPEDPEPEAGPRLVPRIFIAYFGDGLNSASPWQSGARLGLGLVVHPRVRVDAAYGLLAPTRALQTPALDVTRHEVALDVAVGGELGRRITLHGVAVVALQILRWRTSARSGLRPLARVGPMLELGVRLTDGLFLDVGIGGTAALNRFEFVVCDTPDGTCTGEMRDVATSVWSVAPRATVGVSYLFGPKRGR